MLHATLLPVLAAKTFLEDFISPLTCQDVKLGGGTQGTTLSTRVMRALPATIVMRLKGKVSTTPQPTPLLWLS